MTIEKSINAKVNRFFWGNNTSHVYLKTQVLVIRKQTSFWPPVPGKHFCTQVMYTGDGIPTEQGRTWEFTRRKQPRYQGSWGLLGANLRPTGPRWAPCWPHEPCYQGMFATYWAELLVWGNQYHEMQVRYMFSYIDFHDITADPDE